MVFTNDTTKDQAIQQALGALFKNRADFFRLLEKLEVVVGHEVDSNNLQDIIDGEFSSQDEASAEDVKAVLNFISG